MKGTNPLPSLVFVGCASFGLFVALLFVFHVMVPTINFLLDFLSLDIQYQITKNKVSNQEIKLTYISTIDVITNILTIVRV
jgi:hypothetical protein